MINKTRKKELTKAKDTLLIIKNKLSSTKDEFKQAIDELLDFDEDEMDLPESKEIVRPIENFNIPDSEESLNQKADFKPSSQIIRPIENFNIPEIENINDSKEKEELHRH